MLLSSVFSQINWLALLVAGIIHLVSGLIWFQPMIFGKQWTRLSGKSLDPAVRWIPAGIVAHLVMSFVLAIVIYLANATDALSGILVGILMWIGFIVPILTGELIWEKIPFKLFLIRIANQFVGFCISAAILAIWR
jgi:hypothetical protein